MDFDDIIAIMLIPVAAVVLCLYLFTQRVKGVPFDNAFDDLFCYPGDDDYCATRCYL